VRTEITGTVVAGGLQLDQPIEFPDNSRVRVAVEPLDEWQTRFRAGLKAWRQLCQERAISSGGRHYTRDELHERR
jgi:hypothetical protein